MGTYLSVSIGDTSTLLQYVSDNEVVLTHVHPVGIKHIDAYGLGDQAASSVLDGILFALEHVSLYDRIPTEFRIIAPRYATWVKTVVEKYPYAQFYTGSVPVRATIEHIQGQIKEDPSLKHAGHSQTIFTFKI
ncbi:MAG: hypothetical protein QG653_457 [Patescibacteria group bacterium]|nr:hypothetical protein [Patescibacteria group bacterium]